MIGQTISHFSIQEQIGAGGMGVVYRARDERLDREVALKVLSPVLVHDKLLLERFRREARLLSKLNHPNIATVHDFDTVDGTSFLVMELIQGQTLDRKARNQPLPDSEIVRLGTQLLEGLQAAHDAGIIHRDLKPSNLRETPDGRLKILDFGLARIAHTDLETTQSTTTAGVVGTLPYMSPEQLRAENVDARTDIYSAGVVLYELAAGRRPFVETLAPRLIDCILHHPAPSPREFNPQISSGLESVILRALEKSPPLRYQSAREMLNALQGSSEPRAALAVAAEETTLTQSPVEIAKAQDSQRKKSAIPLPRALRWKPAAITLSAVLVAGILAGVLVNRYRRGAEGDNAGTTSGKANVSHITLRPRLAVLGFRNLSNRPDANWISSPLSEMLSHELEAGEHLVTTAGEDVTVAKRDLALREDISYGADTMQRIHRVLHCDYVLYGSFYAPGKAAGGTVKVMLRVQDGKTGEILASLSDEGTEDKLDELTARLGAELREKLHIPSVSPTESEEIQASIPSATSRESFYQGLERLRSFDFLGAREQLQKATAADPNFALAHAYLAEAWFGLGYDDHAREEARRAFELSKRLPREDQRLVEARYREMSAEWDKAVEIYESLWTFYPEKPEYALSAVDVLTRAGRGTDALKTVQTLRDQGGTVAKDPRLDLKESEAAASLGDWAKGKDAATQAANLAGERGSRLLQAEALWQACAALASLGDASGARKACEESMAIAEPLGDLMLVARGLSVLGHIAEAQGEFVQALESHQRALGYARKIGSRRDITGALTNVGNVFSSQGNHLAAEKSYREGLVEAREINDRSQELTLLNNLAAENQLTGDFTAALQLYQRSLDTARKIQDKAGMARALNNVGSIYGMQGNFPAALPSIQEAIKVVQETGQKADEIGFLYTMGDTKLAQGDLASAESSYQAGMQLAEQIKDKMNLALGRLSLSALRVQEGRTEEGMALAKEAADEFHSEGMKDLEIQARNLVASCLITLSREKEAAGELDTIRGLQPQDPTMQLAIAITEARLQVRSGKSSLAKKELQTVAVRAKRIGIPGVQFEAWLAEGEIGLFGGDKTGALSLLSALQQEASRRGYKQFAVRAKQISRQINQGNG